MKPPPSQAPGFRKVQSDVAAKKRKLAQHNPAAAESRSAQDAAVAPPDDKEAQGKAANAEKMNAAKPGEFDKAGFIAAVNEAIAAQAPKNLDEADKFADSGKADKIKGEVDGKVTDGKNASSKDIETTTKAAPDTSQAKEKEVTPMKPDQPPANPGAPNAADATPQQQPPEVTDFSEGPKKTDQQMADADVTEEQLAKSNEPEFTAALGEKKKAEQHSATAPGQARAGEKQQLATAKSHAAGAGTQAMSALTAARAGAGKQVDGGKGETKSKDEQKREEVTAKLQKVFDAAKKDVEGILEGLDGKVDKQFEEGEKKARDAFNKDQKRRMKEYKDKRYGGFWGPAKWAKDKIAGMPEEANQLFQESRKLYVNQMQGVISSIADTIGTELGKAKTRIAKGRAELKAEVDKLPADLKKYGQDAAKDFAGKFDDLESEVNDKSKELVQTLAQKYTQALNAVDEEIKKLQEANKGLVQKAVDAVVGVIKTINDLKNLLMGILAKAASAIMKIIKDPIGFLGNLVRSVGAGLQQFMSNIGTHLQSGLVSWLLGTSVKAGIEIPAKFDLKGIIQLIASLLGLTWANIRSRITRKGVPDQAMSKAEQSVPVAKALATEGPAGAAKEITAETGDLKSTILEELKSYLIPTVIIAGITWILSLLNPASAFVRAAKAIIDIVSFVVNQGAQVVDFVNAVLDAVIAIANGGAAGVPKTIETALAASIPLLIGLLASLLGIGGLANKIKQVFQKVSRPVNRAIDKIVTKIAQAGKKLWRKIRKNSRDVRKKIRKRKNAGGLVNNSDSPQGVGGGGSHAKPTRDGRVDVKREARNMLRAPTSKPLPDRERLDSLIREVLGRLRPHGLKSLRAEFSEKSDRFEIVAKASPEELVAGGSIELSSANYKEILRIAVPSAKGEKGIVAFLKKIAGGGHESVEWGGRHYKVDMEFFGKAWNKPPLGEAREFVKDRFRGAVDGHHEWIPSDRILEIIKREQDAVDGARWIDLQHELRSYTAYLVFHNLSDAPPRAEEYEVDGQRKKYTVPSGHVGAVYVAGKPKTKGTKKFHDGLRNVLSAAQTIRDAAANAEIHMRTWIWDGVRDFPLEIHPLAVDKDQNEVAKVNQQDNFKQVEKNFSDWT
ncbi:hypothetical protein NQU54_36615 [Streptomyces samsunensis]|uniref:Uncharacterized protein n=1 Tax=Streptomyces malaysiensis subsp. samsunensis TaxID=459658 RepID=A0A9X2RZU6_STRMQ|nr:hypothetical protein [Streptomyces samsunensis]